MPTISGGSSGGIPGVTVSGTPAASQALIATGAAAASWAYPPGFEIGYDQITAGVNVVGTTQATGTTVITCAAHTFDGGAVLVTFYSPDVGLATVASDLLGVTLNESGAAIADLLLTRSGVVTTPQPIVALTGTLRFTPSAGSHSYVITAYTASTTGTPAIGAGTGTGGAVTPAFVRFTKV